MDLPGVLDAVLAYVYSLSQVGLGCPHLRSPMPATPPEIPYDVFISYGHRDKTWVKGELLPRLEKAGLKVCLDGSRFPYSHADRQGNGAGSVDQSSHNCRAHPCLSEQRMG